MNTTLKASTLGAILACACTGAFAGPTVTTTQLGSGNTAFAEQSLIDPTAIASATIEQIGNNNHAGDPVAHTGGILQRNVTNSTPANATIYQRGDGNTAGIAQDGVRFPVPAEIRQVGDTNTAAITQNIVTFSDASLHQAGKHNLATLAQVQSGDLGFHGTQHGADNSMAVRQLSSSHGTSTVAQTGAGNLVALLQDNALGDSHIEQIGSVNAANSTVMDDAIESISQIGNGNVASTTQSGGSNSSVIVERGSNNQALVEQSLGSNDSLIRQIGNDNSAVVLQANPAGGGAQNVTSIRQIGNDFAATISQSGGNNHAGVYQH